MKMKSFQTLRLLLVALPLLTFAWMGVAVSEASGSDASSGSKKTSTAPFPGECRNNDKTTPDGGCRKCEDKDSDGNDDPNAAQANAADGTEAPKDGSTCSSFIDNAGVEYHGFGMDYQINNTPSGCGSCGVSGPRTGNTLPSVQITRRMRPCFQNHFIG